MALTPMMKQYLEIKENHQDAILFFRLGDFYEMFMEDAKCAASILEIALTGRDAGMEERIPMCGIPYHAADNYIKKLLNKGYKVAICEQVEDPKLTKGIVKRAVTKIITPGTVLDQSILKEKRNNYLASLVYVKGSYSLSFADITTGEFKTTSLLDVDGGEKIKDELRRVRPAECIFEDEVIVEKIGGYDGYKTFFSSASNKATKLLTFDETIGGSFPSAKKSANLLYAYIEETQKGNLDFLKKVDYYYLKDYLFLDSQTRRNLEITENLSRGTVKNTLLWVLDQTLTAMGGRLLKKWLEQPLMDQIAIKKRQEGVLLFKEDLYLAEKISEDLTEVYDLERILSKLSYGLGNGRDLVALKNSLIKLEKVKERLESVEDHPLSEYVDKMFPSEELINLLERSLLPEQGLTVKDGKIIKRGFDPLIDSHKDIVENSQQMLLDLEALERQKTGIKSLKINYNKVWGYYLEVTKSNLHLVPDYYIRKQTIANGERFIHQELKDLEYKIVHGEEKLKNLEYEAFLQIKASVLGHVVELKETAEAVAAIDVLLSLGKVALKRNYTRPLFDDQNILVMKEARHPVVEALLAYGEYVPNDFYMRAAQENLAIITGPNMAGKSTFIRTLAVLTIMAQCGAFVPAKEFTLGICDRVFARVGASDDLARGESTFMVEMKEVATILNNATEKSLIILDEVGRGTSTLDGLSIAFAVSEYLLMKVKARAVFATHYHELIDLEEDFSNVVNLSMAVKEFKDDVVFLRKVVAGGTSNSYGIHVAKMAGLPESLVASAENKMQSLIRKESLPRQIMLPFVEEKIVLEDPLSEALKRINPDELSPREALKLLYDLKHLSLGVGEDNE